MPDDLLLPALARHGVRLLPLATSPPRERGEIDEFFESHVFPVLTPLAVDPGHPFPYISNLSLSLAVQLREPQGGRAISRASRCRSLCRAGFRVDGRPNHFVPLEQLIGAHLGTLFPGMQIPGSHTFRITRYSDLEIAVEEPEDLLATIEEQVFQRRFGEVVRLEVQDLMPAQLRALLLEELRDDDVRRARRSPSTTSRTRGPLLDLSDLWASPRSTSRRSRIRRSCRVPPQLRDDSSIFDDHPRRRRAGAPSVRLVRRIRGAFPRGSGDDDQVLAIKLTLYRTAGDTALVPRSRGRAARQAGGGARRAPGALRRREQHRLGAALEDAGVHVAFGSATLKTHAKVALVVRRESDGIRRYVHIGTGNYNPQTARLYTDFGCSPAAARRRRRQRPVQLADRLSRQRLYRKLLVAPVNLRDRFIELIEREASTRGRETGADPRQDERARRSEIIEALYRASQAGVEIDLIVRGICCLRPGLPGVSERIRVVSIIGRFLEHSRLWYFANGGAEGVLHRLRRLDAAQFRPSRRGRCAGRQSSAARAAAVAARRLSRGQPPGVGARSRRRVERRFRAAPSAHHTSAATQFVGHVREPSAASSEAGHRRGLRATINNCILAWAQRISRLHGSSNAERNLLLNRRARGVPNH